jgi:CDP-diacylglycerol--serine O-phosphatidyltransferase
MLAPSRPLGHCFCMPSSSVQQKPISSRRFSMLRSYALPDLFTIVNAASGTAAIFLCLSYLSHGDRSAMWVAFALVPFALLCDAFDGWIARKRGQASALGADMDSLSDVVSFGVAPAVVGYTLGLDGVWDVILLVAFVVCGISRLARYNVTSTDLADDLGKVSHFQGTPIPTSVLIVGLLAVAFGTGAVGSSIWLGEATLGPWRLHPLSLVYLVSGSLMISTIKFPKP